MIDTRDSSLFGTRNPMEGEVRIPSGCAIAGIFHKKGGKIGGDTIIRAMEPMHDRSNGLGGGFAGYGIYPDFADCYAFHMFYDNESARDDYEHYLKRFFDIHSMSVMPTRPMRDGAALEIAEKVLEGRNLNELKTLDRRERNSLLGLLLSAGLSVRQIERLTGVSRGIIQSVKPDK